MASKQSMNNLLARSVYTISDISLCVLKQFLYCN